MKAPEKKPLVRREAPDEVRAKIRKGDFSKDTSSLSCILLLSIKLIATIPSGAGVAQASPIKILSDFEGPSLE